MSEESVLVCLPCNDNEPKVQSIIDVCGKCMRSIWRALSSPEADLVLCTACAVRRIEQENAQLQPLTKEQIADIKRWSGR